MGLIAVVEDLDGLGLEAGRQKGRQGTLALQGNLSFTLRGKRHIGKGGVGHGGSPVKLKIAN